MSLYKFLKMTMFAVNFIIFVGGAAIMGVGIWIKVDGGSFLTVLQHVSSSLKVLANVGYLCIALGAFLMAIGFLGCCGAMKENKCMLMIFFLIILVIFLAQLVAAVVILAFSGLVRFLEKKDYLILKCYQADIFMSYIATWLKDFFKNGYGRIQELTELFNVLMAKFKCCGMNGYTDFLNSHFVNSTGGLPSACRGTAPGCYQVFLNFLKNNTIILGIVALVIAVLEMGAMVSSMIMYCQINKMSNVA